MSSLEDCIRNGWDCRQDWLGGIWWHMLESNLHQWGFVVYRCVYGDDEAWEKYIKYLKEAVYENLQFYGREDLLDQYQQWTIIEDAEKLNGASKSTVGRHFIEWRDEQLSRIQLQSVAADEVRHLPRFKYCVYVDRKCLQTLKKHAEGKAITRYLGAPPSLVVVVIDTLSNEIYDTIESCNYKYVGWTFYDARYLAGLYDRLHRDPLNDYNYQRPPKIGPTGLDSIDDLIASV